MEWEVVIGLEVHVQLSTKSKLFSGASTRFGAEPNTQACAVDLAMPGTLPAPNEEAFRCAVLFALAMNAHIGKRSVFERKNYFYPDLPKGYQTTQLDQPIVGAGEVEIYLADGSNKTVRLHHAHLEEDAGKSLHEDFHGMSGIDLNRAGTPLLEIVSEPDMRSAAEAVAFLKKIHSIVTYLDISDGDMSQGSMRCDANVSVRPKGEAKLGTRTELKNINSFRFVERAIKAEAGRQIDVLEDGGNIVQETRLYDVDKDETRSLRSKEAANDYRYFPCPDLLPVVLSNDYIEQLRHQLPELPDAKTARFRSEYSLSAYDANLLTQERANADYFETVCRVCNAPKLAANWITGEISALLKRREITISQSPVSPEQLASLIVRIKDNTLSSKIAKRVFDALTKSADMADDIIQKHGYIQLSDSRVIEKMVDEVIATNSAQVENYRKADEAKRPRMMGYFVGRIMKASSGQANPKILNKILKEKLDALL
ncbi:Asp-tRNA(Asn)/Glu-tRNA(Gln) amidotransferase subunit GatB [Microbulbifer sp. 2304DJ12-6]|uniref:Asp-tRNA(Asn)/Glu-tRNA(Gln) amidotransferase subunit GatB n=1 Tax=Microbulbifer sp. 2304DJ12-6 TaxID=3233340 RepID=UPI0039AF8D36